MTDYTVTSTRASARIVSSASRWPMSIMVSTLSACKALQTWNRTTHRLAQMALVSLLVLYLKASRCQGPYLKDLGQVFFWPSPNAWDSGTLLGLQANNLDVLSLALEEFADPHDCACMQQHSVV